MPTSSNNMPMLAAVGAGCCVFTYYLTNFLRDQIDEKKRADHYRVHLEAKLALQEAQKSQSLPSGTLVKEVMVEQVYMWEVEQLGARFPPAGKRKNLMQAPSLATKTNQFFPMLRNNNDAEAAEQPMATEYNKLIASHECVLADIVRRPQTGLVCTRAYVRAGPRPYLHFDPAHVSAAIVTCGGLCPGLNNVVREIVKTLSLLYGIGGNVYGIRGGFKGFYDDSLPPLVLTVDMVENIHHDGGTILGSSRGGFDLEKILSFLKSKRISQLYVIGGDGTHRGAFTIHEGCMAKGLNVSVAGIPKTIDNDVDYIDRSFGFSSAVEASQAAIRSAKTEAVCNLPNGIGIVKLMGRSAGFIAVHATMASGDVDLCLVPEVPTILEGENGCLPHLMRCVKEKGYAVVIVAEGAGEELLGASIEMDASGNKRLPMIGEFMKAEIEKYFVSQGDIATVKYIDPSYMIRSIPANAADALYCMQLGQNAVHGAMAGFTGFTVGLCNNRMVLLPIPEVVATSPRNMNPRGRTWERVLAVTRQPNTVPPKKEGEPDYDSYAPMLR